MTVNLLRYDSSRAEEWDAFVARSKNGTFMHSRPYVEYHAHRFDDVSVMAYADGELVGVMPANLAADVEGTTLQTHGGLTYGGWVLSRDATLPLVLHLFDVLDEWCRGHGVTSVLYKRVPAPYHSLPADEDDYALFLRRATRVAHDVSSVISLRNAPAISTRRLRGVRRALRAGVAVREAVSTSRYHELLTRVLDERHSTSPTHSAEELEHLVSRFPSQIRTYEAAAPDGELLAGVVVYDCDQTVHAQYLAAGPRGRAVGALDLALYTLITTTYRDRTYFSLGASTEAGGRRLNTGLVDQKEMFGARAVTCATYAWSVAGAPAPSR